MCFRCYLQSSAYGFRVKKQELFPLKWGWTFHKNYCYSYRLTYRDKFQIALTHYWWQWRWPKLYKHRPDTGMLFVGPFEFGWKK